MTPKTQATKTLTTRTIRVIRAPRDPALNLRFGLLVRNALSGRQYRVGEPLGTGGFGAVYRAVWDGVLSPYRRVQYSLAIIKRGNVPIVRHGAIYRDVELPGLG